ncbi:MAG: hypothetical protein R3C45_15690 [Phycisphaerales bacterium]
MILFNFQGTFTYASDADTEWELEQLGLDYPAIMRTELLAYFVTVDQGVTALHEVGKGGLVWAGTSNGIFICNADGTIRNRVLHMDWTGDDRYIYDRLYTVIRDFVPLDDGTIWVRGLRGAHRLDESGNVLQVTRSDKAAIEQQFELMLKERALQRFFPVYEGRVLIPWSGKCMAEYDGKSWYLQPRPRAYYGRIHVLGARALCSGPKLIDAKTAEPLFDDMYTFAQHLASDSMLCMAQKDLWLIQNEKSVSIGESQIDNPTGGFCRVNDNLFVWSSPNMPAIGILWRDDGGLFTAAKTIRLPKNHDWIGFHSYPRTISSRLSDACGTAVTLDQGVGIYTTSGIVIADRDELERIVKDESEPSDRLWHLVVDVGTPTTSCIPKNVYWLLGTREGLMRYNVVDRTVVNVWDD